MNHFDALANLLSNEDLMVVRKSVETAAFDLKERVLYLPIWENLTIPQEEMLICHEVSHALFSEYDVYSKLEEHGIPQSYLNVVDDVRVESLLKERYPGSKRTFYNGYKDFYEADFFDLANQSYDEYLIDKMNLHYKIGLFHSVEFLPEEKVFVERGLKLRTMEDAIELAKEIYAYDKKRTEEREQEESEDRCNPYNYTITMGEGAENQSKDSPVMTKSVGNGNEKSEERELEAKTDKIFSDRVKNHISTADNPPSYLYVDETIDRDPIIDYRTILKDTKESFERYYKNDGFKNELKKFYNENGPSVDYLVNEFERKRAAKGYKRDTIARSGLINSRKLHSYQVNPDIFKRINISFDEKNHGMIMLIDMSISMDNVYPDVMKQTIMLAMFCRKIGIPFEVYGFSGVPRNHESTISLTTDKLEEKKTIKNCLPIVLASTFYLNNLFSSRMSTAEFNEMVERFVLSPQYCLGVFDDRYRLYNTPFNSALVYMLKVIPDFKKYTGCEKVSFITITDGESNDTILVKYGNGQFSINAYINHLRGTPIIIKDHKKEYKYNSRQFSFTRTMLQIIKDRYQVDMVSFFYSLKPTMFSSRDITWFPSLSFMDFDIDYMKPEEKQEINSVYKKTGHCILDGIGKVFIAKVKAHNDRGFNLDSIDHTSKRTEIVRSLKNTMIKKLRSKIVLGGFIDSIA